MKYIIGLFSLILFTILPSASTFAQDKTETNQPENTFNFYFINGYAISYDFYEAKSYYLRAGLDISTSKSDIDSDGENIQSYDNYSEQFSNSDNNDDSYFAIGTSVQIIFPVYETEFGKFYLGTGPIFTYSTHNYNSSSTLTYSNPDTNFIGYSTTTTIEGTQQNYDLGAIFLIGLEGIITKNISLFVEANITGGARWQNDEWERIYTYSSDDNYNSKQTSNSEGNGWFYEARFIRLGVSISL